MSPTKTPSHITKPSEISDEKMAEFVKSIENLDPAERALKLTEFATNSVEGITYDPDNLQKKATEAISLALTDKQFETLMEGGAQEAIKKVAETAQKNLGLNTSGAREVAERKVSTFIEKQYAEKQEHQLAVDVFKQINAMTRGHGQIEDLVDSHKREAEYLGRETIFTDQLKREGVETFVRAMTLGTDSSGGFLAPELWITSVYEALAKTGTARRLATLVSMTTEILRLPKITSGFTANIVAELVAATPEQPVFAQFTLAPQKIVVLTKAFSHELMVNADPAIIPLLTHLATIAFGRKEDEMMFVGSDGSVTGWLEETQNVVTMSSGNTAITDIDFDDYADLEDALDEQYMPDEDVQNSGGITGDARYFHNKKAKNVLQKLKGNDNYFWGDVGSSRPKEIWGHATHRIIDMPSAPSVATAFASFGNPKYTYFGFYPGIWVDVLKEATIDSVDLAAKAGMALRLIEYVDTKLIDNNAIANLKTAAS